MVPEYQWPYRHSAEAGIQGPKVPALVLDPRFRGGDEYRIDITRQHFRSHTKAGRRLFLSADSVVQIS
jgi:hypothetical protein